MMNILHKNKISTVSVFFTMVAVMGCGLLGENKIENSIINADLEQQRIKDHGRRE